MRRRHETRFMLILIGLLSAIALVGSFSVVAIESAGGLTPGSFTIYPTTAKPNLAPAHGSAEVGTKFTVDASGSVTALRYYRGMSSTSARTATLWSTNGQALAQATFSSHGTGWQTAYLSRRVPVRAGATYIVGFHADQGAYYQQPDKLAKGHTIGNEYIHAVAGMMHRGGAAFPSTPTSNAFFADVVFVPSSGVTTSSSSASAPSSPTTSTSSASTTSTPPTTSTSAGGGASSPPKASSPSKSASSGSGSSTSGTGPDISGGFPNASTTGVPAGVSLAAYSGPMTISSCQTISGVVMTGNVTITASNGSSSASSPCVTIENSKIVGTINTGPTPGVHGPLVLSHVEVAPPQNSAQQAVLGTDFYLYNVNVHGGANGGIDCAGACGIYNSWVHDFYLAGATHYDGIISNGLYKNAPLVIQHNSLECNFYASAGGATGGCSAAIGLFGDFAPTSNVTIDQNLFIANTAQAYCMYGGYEPSKAYSSDTNVVVTNNTFQRGSNGKCGSYGPVAYFSNAGSGNTWSGNVWDNGSVLTP
jgi:hypothetical protein